MSSTDEPGGGMADSDINSTDPDGTNHSAGEGSVQDTTDDADRGNLDGSAPVAEPRDRSLDEAGGNGSFDDASESSGASEASEASDAGDSGQDNGLNE